MRRRAGALAVIAVLATACGSGSSGSSAAQGDKDVLSVIQAAASTTAEQRTQRFRGTMTMDLGAVTGSSTGTVSADLAGTMQNKPLAGRMTISGMQVAGQDIGDVTALITPDAMYMKMPMLADRVGKPWIEFKFSDLKAASGFDFSQFTSQAQQMQPSQYIAQLAASGDVHAVGTETVNGVSTTHYAGSVSVEESLSHYSASMRRQLEPVMKQAGFTGSDIDVWLDGKGLVRRVRSSAQGGKGTFSMSMDVLAYGVPVDVTPPPTSQVVDLGQMAAGGSFG
jgi:hypothetical protein